MKLVVVSAGLSVPSSTRLLGDRLAAAVGRAAEVDVQVVELRELAVEIAQNFTNGFPGRALAAAQEAVAGADGLIVVTPVFSASYSGLFKSFFDVLEPEALEGKPVLIAATGGSARHSLVLEHALRPLFAYLKAVVVPTGVYAASEDWGAEGLDGRIERAAGELAALMAGLSVGAGRCGPGRLVRRWCRSSSSSPRCVPRGERAVRRARGEQLITSYDSAGRHTEGVPQNVLLAEDDRAIRHALERALTLEGYQVTAVADGVEALAQAHRTPPDVLVLDVMMPGIDGLQVCRVLRAEGDRTPILMLTALVETQDRIAGLDAGADDYVVKPFDVEEVFARLRALLRRTSPDGMAPAAGRWRGSRGRGARRCPRGGIEAAGLRMDIQARRAWRGDARAGADPDRVRAAGTAGAQRGHRAGPFDDLRPHLGLRLRARLQEPRRLRRLSAPQARRARRPAADPHGARRGLRAAGGLSGAAWAVRLLGPAAAPAGWSLRTTFAVSSPR